jgi:hypothetical protein
MVFLVVVSSSEAVGSCKGGEHVDDLRVAGSVSYSAGGQSCLMNGDEKVCFENHDILRDECMDTNTVAKFFCDGELPARRSVKCPDGGKCEKGACR